MQPVTSETIWSFDLRTLKVRRHDTDEEFDPNDLLFTNPPDFYKGNFESIEPFEGDRYSFAYVEWMAACLQCMSFWFQIISRLQKGMRSETYFFSEPCAVEIDPEFDLNDVDMYLRPGVSKKDRIREITANDIKRWWSDTVASPENAGRICQSQVQRSVFARIACIQSVHFSTSTGSLSASA